MADDTAQTLCHRLKRLVERFASLFIAFWTGMLALALLIAWAPWFQDTPRVAGVWLTPWVGKYSEALAAWVQAIGSVAAIYFAGRSAERLFDRQRAHDLARDAETNLRRQQSDRYRVMEVAVDLRRALQFLLIRNQAGLHRADDVLVTKVMLQTRILVPEGFIKTFHVAKQYLDAFGYPLGDSIVGLHADMEFWNQLAADTDAGDFTLKGVQEYLEATTNLTPKRLESVKAMLEPFLPDPNAAQGNAQEVKPRTPIR